MRTLGLALLLVLAPASVHAQGRLTVEWSGPEGCGGEDEVRAEVTRLLGGAIPEEGPPIDAEAHAVPREGGFALELRTRTDGAEGVRSLEAADCAALVDACGLILALMIDPEAALAGPAEPDDPEAPAAGEAPDPQEAPEGPAEPPGVASVARQLSSPTLEAGSEAAEGPRGLRAAEPLEGSREPGGRAASAPGSTSAMTDTGSPTAPTDGPSVFFGVGGLLDLTTLPGVSGGPFLDVGVGGPLVEGRLRVTYLAPQSAREAAREVGAELMAVDAAARVCVRPFEEARWIGGCAGLDLGAVFGTGFGVSDPSFGAGFWMGGTLGLGVAWRALEWLDLSVDADLVIPLVDNVFAVVLPDGDIDVFVPEDVGGRLSVSLHVHFGL